MTDIEQKALELVNEVSDGFHDVTSVYDIHTAKALRSALCLAIERHEAFRQEVSDYLTRYYENAVPALLRRFIIAKPDPLVEALRDSCEYPPSEEWLTLMTSNIRAALAKRNGRIVFDD